MASKTFYVCGCMEQGDQVFLCAKHKQPPSGPPVTDQDAGQKYRIWVLHCLFKKNGSPSLGSFGQTERPVVIIPLPTWQKLCAENPALAATQFEVGSES